MNTEEQKKRKKTLVVVAAVMCGILLIGFSLIGRGDTPTETDMVAMSETRKAVVFQTREAEPTRTPAPVCTRDTRPLGERHTSSSTDAQTPFEKCVDSGRGVRYVIAGEGVSGVSLTWKNDSGGTDQGDYNVPFCKTYSGFEDSDFLYISAQIIQGGGHISCYVYDGVSVIAEANANGFASIATCSGSAK